MPQSQSQPTKDGLYISLIALWALVESGLGGIMHALHLPFTGVIIGGFAVLCIALIAYTLPNPMHAIFKATLLVLVVKALVNPATSPTAYVAVMFQGVLGAILLQRKSWIPFAAIPFALISMLESAFQKIALLWIVFGNSLPEAFDAFVGKVLGIFMTAPDSRFALWAVIIYCLIYVVWGILLGIWIIQLPKNLNKRKEWYQHIQPQPISTSFALQKSRKPNRKYILLGLLLLGCLTYFIQTELAWQKGLFLIIRVLGILALWIYVVVPAVQKLIIKWTPKWQEKQPIFLVNQEINSLRSWLKPLQVELKKKYKGFKLLKELVFGMMVIALYEKR